MTSYRNGSTAGTAGFNANPSKRGNVTGWSAGAVRRHTKWLYSIDTGRLDGNGYALTLTMKNTPDTAEDFTAMRRAWVRRVERLGASRIHWVVEWQRRGTPHVHAAVYFPDGAADQYPGAPIDVLPALALLAWVDLAEPYVATQQAQYFDHISGASGWLKYLSKHASRGVKHYQRSGHPEGWEKTGRLWGHGGDWPVDAPMKFKMDNPAYWRYRRLVRSWRIADARRSGDASRIQYARRMLQSSNPRLSAVRGVSDWVPEDVSLTFVALLESEGFTIEQVSDLDGSESVNTP